ncbi:hypothetical protein ACW9HR_37400 [Nocardia gipuzkoensis]
MSEYKIGGVWTLKQSNGPTVTMDLEQSGDQFTGIGSYSGGTGKAKGRVNGDKFVVTIDWDNSGPGRGGEYTGTFAPNGRLYGLAIDLDRPSSTATWFSNRTFGR